MEVRLILTHGSTRQREVPLPPTIFLLGRGPKCHLRPHCKKVSKLHCAIARWAGKVVVRDLKSANGTYVNGERIRGEAILKDGDILRVGTLEFVVQISSEVRREMPVQVVHEGDVKWLMEAPADPMALDPSATVAMETQDSLVGSGSTETSESLVSAGQYLHDYFKRQESR